MAAIFGHIGGGLNGDGAGASGLFKSESSFFQPIATGRVPCCLVNTVHCYGSLTQQCDDIILSEFGRLHGLLGLHITQVDIEATVIDDTHIQLAAVQREGEWSGTYFTVDLNPPNIIGGYAVILVLPQSPGVIDITDGEPFVVTVPLIFIGTLAY